ncbi:MAG: hypothetical protein ACRCSG_02635 [Cellulosilyticaceae bacterium]
MEQLFDILEEINQLLEQIQTITQNQMTILLEASYIGEGTGLVEEMADFKENLTTEVEQKEKVFQRLYNEHNTHIINVEDKQLLKTLVDRIMKTKQHIIEGEQKNVMIMQNLLHNKVNCTTTYKTPQHVANAYKAQRKA